MNKEQIERATAKMKSGDLSGGIEQMGRELGTIFGGVADNKSINIVTSVNRMSQLLIRAVNNRTRERNYFRLYSQLLEGEITEEDFDKEIDDNENEYVVANNETADKTDIEIALSVSPQLMDVKDVDDMADIFSFDIRSIRKSISSESHG